MANKASPAVTLALKHIEKCIESARATGARALPTIADMAKHAGVSVVTMWKAVHALVDKGMITCSQRRGIFIAGMQHGEETDGEGANTLMADLDTRFVWRRVKAQLAGDILNNVYPPNTVMPSYKELQHRYGASFRTIKKALTELRAQKLLQTHKHGYRVCPLGRTTASSQIVLLFYQDPESPGGLSELDMEFIRELEVQCSQNRLVLTIITYRESRDSLFYSEYGTGSDCILPQHDSILGFIVLVNDIGHIRESVLMQLAHTRKKIAVHDVVGGWDLPKRFTGYTKNYALFLSTASMLPGRDVARYLLGIGHKHAAYISPFHATAWSHNRLKGLEEVFGSAGRKHSIRAYVDAHHRYPYQFLAESNAVMPLRMLQQLKAQIEKQIPSETSAQFQSAFKDFVEKGAAWPEVIVRLTPLFKDALKDESITAWVLSNDLIAPFALDFLRKKKIEPGKDISVVSFDDILRALTYHVTSYNFNIAGLTGSILRFLLWESKRAPQRKRRIVEIQGTIVERQTSGPAPARS
jgi:DNA-binding GntR family transcriptional regulator